MKTLFILSLSFFSATAFAQNSDTAAANAAIKTFTWDIQKETRGTLMFLDVAYQRDGKDSIEYLTLTVAKDKTQKRPVFISMIVPDNVSHANGIFIQFGRTTKDANGNWQNKLDDAKPIRVNFEGCNSEQQTCTARIIDSYATDETTKEKVDVFQKFLDFDNVYFLFMYPDGSHKSVGVPLFTFKDQYKALP